jgi:hypothetical protein
MLPRSRIQKGPYTKAQDHVLKGGPYSWDYENEYKLTAFIIYYLESQAAKQNCAIY